MNSYSPESPSDLLRPHGLIFYLNRLSGPFSVLCGFSITLVSLENPYEVFLMFPIVSMFPKFLPRVSRLSHIPYMSFNVSTAPCVPRAPVFYWFRVSGSSFRFHFRSQVQFPVPKSQFTVQSSQVPRVQFRFPGFRSQVPGSQFLVPVPGSPVPGPGFRFQVRFQFRVPVPVPVHVPGPSSRFQSGSGSVSRLRVPVRKPQVPSSISISRLYLDPLTS